MYEKKLTLMEHLETADDLALIYTLIIKIYNRTKKQYPKTHPISKGLDKFILNYLPMLQDRFDNEFHKSIDDKTWKKLEKEWGGHIYYNLKKRLSK
jgi:hypothetical protein